MHIQQNDNHEVCSGSFSMVELDFTPEFPPLEPEERFSHKANYPTTLAYVHISLDQQLTSRNVSSAYLLLLLDGLLAGLVKLCAGQTATAEWFSDPWQIVMRSVPESNIAYITLQMPGKHVVIQDAAVPLDKWGDAVMELASKWSLYLTSIYPDEVEHPEKGKAFERFKGHVSNARTALAEYKAGI